MCATCELFFSAQGILVRHSCKLKRLFILREHCDSAYIACIWCMQCLPMDGDSNLTEPYCSKEIAMWCPLLYHHAFSALVFLHISFSCHYGGQRSVGSLQDEQLGLFVAGRVLPCDPWLWGREGLTVSHGRFPWRNSSKLGSVPCTMWPRDTYLRVVCVLCTTCGKHDH